MSSTALARWTGTASTSPPTVEAVLDARRPLGLVVYLGPRSPGPRREGGRPVGPVADPGVRLALTSFLVVGRGAPPLPLRPGLLRPGPRAEVGQGRLPRPSGRLG